MVPAYKSMLFLLHSVAFFLCCAGHCHHKASSINNPQFVSKLCSNLVVCICNYFSHRYNIKLIKIQSPRVFLRSELQIFSTYNATPMTVANIEIFHVPGTIINFCKI